MKKRLIAMLLAFCMVLSVVPLHSNAVLNEVIRVGNWVVGRDDRMSSKYLITGYTGYDANVTVPTKLDRYTIHGIHNSTFMENTTLRTLNVPDGITVYGLGGCDVQTVNMGKNAIIGESAFEDCKKLKTVNIPENQTELPALAFKNCVSVASVTIPEGIQTIGESAFEGCTSLTAVILPDNVTKIGIRAFSGCTELREINIPAAVKDIGYDAFDNCQSLAKISVASGNAQYFNSSDGSLCFTHKNGEVYLVRGLSVGCGDSYTIPSNVQRIKGHAFSGANGLKKLVIPGNVTRIESDAFENCINLKEIRFTGTAPIVSSNAFKNVTAKAFYPGDLGEESRWGYFDFAGFGDNLTWIPYCTGIHIGSTGTVITAPTCSETGVASSVCDLCGQTYSEVLPKTAHTYGEGVVTKAATCTKEGMKEYTCTDCGDTKTESYLAEHNLDYSKENILYGSTCTSEGMGEYPCKDCGSLIQIRLSCIDHIYEDGRCTMCGRGVVRIYGEDRYQTAFKVADELKSVLDVEKFQNVVVASGVSFPDALAGSYLAAVKNAPILLVRGANANDVKDYIQANLIPGGTVYLLGGINAVPKSMETGLDDFNVKRLGGANRYDTNLLILQEAGLGSKNLIVCTGRDFADSLSASALGMPILLVKDGLTADQKEFLKSSNKNVFTIIGGTNAVSETVERQLKEYGFVNRIAGNTRYTTSVNVAEKLIPHLHGVVLAYAMNFPDGLCGGPLAYNQGMALILTASGAEDIAASYATGCGINGGYVLGGTRLIRDGIVKKIFAVAADETITVK